MRILTAFLILFLLLGSSFSQADSPQGFETGLFYGSFDPPTLGHKNLALEIAQKYGIKKFYVVVKTSGEKNQKASASERIHLLEQMWKVSNGLEIEILEEWHARYPEMVESILQSQENKKLALIYGEDVYHKNYNKLSHLEGVWFFVGYRPGDNTVEKDGSWLRSRTTDIQLSPFHSRLSSTQARQRLLDGTSTKGILAGSVTNSIVENSLYLPSNSWLSPDEQQRDYELRVKNFLESIVSEYSGLKIPSDFGLYEPQQSLDAEKERAIKFLSSHNQLTPMEAWQLWESLRSKSYTLPRAAAPMMCKALFL